MSLGLLSKNTRHLVDEVLPDNPHTRFTAMGRVIVVVLELPPDIDQFRLLNLMKPIIRPLLNFMSRLQELNSRMLLF